MTHLHCIGAACGATFDLHTPLMACPKCGELLEVVVDTPKADAAELKRCGRSGGDRLRQWMRAACGVSARRCPSTQPSMW